MMGKPIVWMPGKIYLWNLQHTFYYLIPETLAVLNPLVQLFFSKLCSLSHAYDGRHVLRARPSTAFLDTAINERDYPRPLFYVKGTSTLGSIELVSRHAQEINSQFFYIHRDVPYSGHSICMKNNIPFLRNLRNFSQWLNGTDFAARMCHGNECRLVGDRLPHHFRVNQSVLINGHPRDNKSTFLEKAR